jgi:hypothetical protein
MVDLVGVRYPITPAHAAESSRHIAVAALVASLGLQ